MAENTSSAGRKTDERAPGGSSADPCANGIDREAPAGARNSLGAKSDCNGRPATDDSVVEAMDEAGPITKTTGNGGR